MEASLLDAPPASYKADAPVQEAKTAGNLAEGDSLDEDMRCAIALSLKGVCFFTLASEKRQNFTCKRKQRQNFTREQAGSWLAGRLIYPRF